MGGESPASIMNQPLPSMSSLVFAVITTPKYHGTRVRALQQTWCGQEGVKCLFISDGVGDTSGFKPDIVQQLNPELQAVPDKYERAQYRFMPALQEVHSVIASSFPQAKWLVLVDDDTYVLMHNLRVELSKQDPTQAIYMGEALDALAMRWACGKNGEGGCSDDEEGKQ